MEITSKVVVNGIELDIPVSIKGEDVIDALCKHFKDEKDKLKVEMLDILKHSSDGFNAYSDAMITVINKCNKQND